ncbi:MAG: diaminopimelate decarboxylase [Fimbriimonadaceae bacterium]|nr:diaminopimelate decarboxylase [Fimbriimonadaceae bacterium]QYK55484.1 MAG: diaminopimelate decarboxylase [Fimbriimonadaceae bacterium]
MGSPVASDERFVLDPALVEGLVNDFGTPLYVLDGDHLRARARRQVAAWPHGEVAYASKANSCLAVLRTVHSEGCAIDVASEGELRAALAAGVPASACRFHGNAKSSEEIDFALEVGVGKAIVDGDEELAAWADRRARLPILLRLAPGVDPVTHAKISTGQADTKFGFPLDRALDATQRALDLGLNLVGYHCHVGSQLLEPGAQIDGALAVVRTALSAKDRLGFGASHLNLGGGLGVRYMPQDEPLTVEEYSSRLAEAVFRELDGRIAPKLDMEPGRAMVAESGVTLYRVAAVKEAASGRVFVSVDGGMSDNPRPGLYGARYELRWPLARTSEMRTVTVSGKHCESDTLFADVPAPRDVRKGDFVQVLCTGAYNSSMASNYNRYPRPATVLMVKGRPELVQLRETWDQVLSRERLPEGL